MSKLTVPGSRSGDVSVNEELVQSVGGEMIDAAIAQLRFAGGKCWACDERIYQHDDVCLVLHRTAIAGRLGFIHYRCGPPQIMDRVRSQRSAIAMREYLEEISDDVQAFASVRNWLVPRAMMVISSAACITSNTESGDARNLLVGLSLRHGFVPLGPDICDAAPGLVDDWALHITGETVVCRSPDGVLFEGRIPLPEPWLAAVAAERRCVVIVSGVGLSTTEIGPGWTSAANMLAEKGLVAGGTVEVNGIIGICAAAGISGGSEYGVAVRETLSQSGLILPA